MQHVTGPRWSRRCDQRRAWPDRRPRLTDRPPLDRFRAQGPLIPYTSSIKLHVRYLIRRASYSILLPVQSLAIPSRCRPHTEGLFPSSIVRFTPAVFYSELMTGWRDFPSPRPSIRGRGPRTNTSRGTLLTSSSSIDATPSPESSRRSLRC